MVKRRLVDLPHRPVAKLKPGTPLTYREAAQVQQALLIQLLLVAPMRLRNLVRLELDRHVVAPSGPDGERLIVIPAGEVKNAEPLTHLLSRYTAHLLRLYFELARPMLLAGLSPHYDGIIASLRGPAASRGVGRMGTFAHRSFGGARGGGGGPGTGSGSDGGDPFDDRLDRADT